MKKEHTIDLHGKQHILYPGLLAMAHEIGLQAIEEEIVQIPTPENGEVAIVKAVVIDDCDRRFSGIGDCSPKNVSRGIAAHSLRMASTRAKARAMRDLCNVGADPELEEEASEPLRPVPSQEPPQEAASANEHNYIYSMLNELGADVTAFQEKHGDISEYGPEKSSRWIESLQKRLDTKRALEENPEESVK